MTLLVRFLVFNLLVSLAGGLLAWLIVIGVMRLLSIRSSMLSLCFLALPFFKSLLLLVGIGLIFPWPGRWFAHYHALALPFIQVLPYYLIWAGTAYVAYLLLVRRARQAVLEEAKPASMAAPRLAAAYASVLEAYRQSPDLDCDDDLCCAGQPGSTPRLFVSERLNSPIALTDGGEPAILFPAGLVPRLDDVELAGALAHELAHFYLRRPNWCSAGTLQKLALINPLAVLVGEYLHRLEEKACDSLAVKRIGQPERYAGMLTQCYRFASQQADHSAMVRLHLLPRLLGFKPLLSERVEHLLASEASPAAWKQSKFIIWLTWALLFCLLFVSWI